MKTQQSISIDIELVKVLDEFCYKTRITKSSVMCDALNMYFGKYIPSEGI